MYELYWLVELVVVYFHLKYFLQIQCDLFLFLKTDTYLFLHHTKLLSDPSFLLKKEVEPNILLPFLHFLSFLTEKYRVVYLYFQWKHMLYHIHFYNMYTTCFVLLNASLIQLQKEKINSSSFLKHPHLFFFFHTSLYIHYIPVFFEQVSFLVFLFYLSHVPQMRSFPKTVLVQIPHQILRGEYHLEHDMYLNKTEQFYPTMHLLPVLFLEVFVKPFDNLNIYRIQKHLHIVMLVLMQIHMPFWSFLILYRYCHNIH